MPSQNRPENFSPKFSTFAAMRSLDTKFRRRSDSFLLWVSPRPASWCARMRSIIVTGGSRGLGLGIARRLAGDGYRVIALARSETSPLTSAIREAADDSLHFIPFD